MTTYIIRRTLLMFMTLMIISFLSYAMMRLAPGDPVKSTMLGAGGSGEQAGMDELKGGESDQAKAFRRRFNLDLPWYQGYWYWLVGSPSWTDEEEFTRPETGGIIRGDFGVSVSQSINTPVLDIIGEALPITIKLNICAMIIIYLVSIPIGIYSAVWRGGKFDNFFTIFFFILYSMPSFWVGLLLIIFVSRYFPWWPTSGITSDLGFDANYWSVLGDTALHYVLPVFCMSFGAFASLSRFARVGLLEVIRQDYIRTARAKGAKEHVVIFKHALRNSLIPLVTIFAGLLPSMIGGSMIIEYLFNIPGMGLLGVEALSSRDYPLLMTLFMLGSTLTLVGIFLSDILLTIVDPRISLD